MDQLKDVGHASVSEEAGGNNELIDKVILIEIRRLLMLSNAPGVDKVTSDRDLLAIFEEEGSSDANRVLLEERLQDIEHCMSTQGLLALSLPDPNLAEACMLETYLKIAKDTKIGIVDVLAYVGLPTNLLIIEDLPIDLLTSSNNTTTTYDSGTHTFTATDTDGKMALFADICTETLKLAEGLKSKDPSNENGAEAIIRLWEKNTPNGADLMVLPSLGSNAEKIPPSKIQEETRPKIAFDAVFADFVVNLYSQENGKYREAAKWILFERLGHELCHRDESFDFKKEMFEEFICVFYFDYYIMKMLEKDPELKQSIREVFEKYKSEIKFSSGHFYKDVMEDKVKEQPEKEAAQTLWDYHLDRKAGMAHNVKVAEELRALIRGDISHYIGKDSQSTLEALNKLADDQESKSKLLDPVHELVSLNMTCQETPQAIEDLKKHLHESLLDSDNPKSSSSGVEKLLPEPAKVITPQLPGLATHALRTNPEPLPFQKASSAGDELVYESGKNIIDLPIEELPLGDFENWNEYIRALLYMEIRYGKLPLESHFVISRCLGELKGNSRQRGETYDINSEAIFYRTNDQVGNSMHILKVTFTQQGTPTKDQWQKLKWNIDMPGDLMRIRGIHFENQGFGFLSVEKLTKETDISLRYRRLDEGLETTIWINLEDLFDKVGGGSLSNKALRPNITAFRAAASAA